MTETTERVEKTQVGYHLRIASKRGTGTRDQDKVTVDLKTTERPGEERIGEVCADVEFVMDRRRGHQPDAEDDGDD